MSVIRWTMYIACVNRVNLPLTYTIIYIIIIPQIALMTTSVYHAVHHAIVTAHVLTYTVRACLESAPRGGRAITVKLVRVRGVVVLSTYNIRTIRTGNIFYWHYSERKKERKTYTSQYRIHRFKQIDVCSTLLTWFYIDSIHTAKLIACWELFHAKQP